MTLPGCEIIENADKLTVEDWLKVRQGGIGGSDAGALLGYSKYSSPMMVYLSKTAETIEEIDNPYTYWGKALEPVIRDRLPEFYLKEFGKKIETERYPYVMRSIEHPFMLANIDGLAIIDGATCGLEIKTATVMQQRDWQEGELPDVYYAQVQHYLAVTGLYSFLVAALVGKEMKIREVPRNEKFIARLIKIEQDFWENNVEEKSMPGPLGIDAEHDFINGEHVGGLGEIDLSEFEDLAKEYVGLNKAAKEIDSQKKEIAATLKIAIGDHDKGIAGAYNVNYTKTVTKRFQTTVFKKDHPDLHSEYVKESEGTRFTITGGK